MRSLMVELSKQGRKEQGEKERGGKEQYEMCKM